MYSGTESAERVRFGEVVTLVSERVTTAAESAVDRYVGLDHIDPDDLRLRRWGMVDTGTTFTSRFRPGHVLFGKRRAYQRKVALADFDGVCSGDIYVLKVKGTRLLAGLAPFLCQSGAFLEHAVATSAGSLSPRTNWKALSQFEFVLPPLHVQERALEVLLSMEDAIETNRDLGSQLARTAGATIAWLAGPLLDVHPGTVPPDGWRAATIDDVCALSSGNGFRPEQWADAGLPIIRIQNLNGSTDFKYYSGEAEPRWLVEPGQLLFAWAGVPGVSFGPTIWDGPTGVLNQHIFRVTPKVGVAKRWLYEALKRLTPVIERRAHGFKTSLLHIRRADLVDRPVLVPPFEVQREIERASLSFERLKQEHERRLSQLHDVKRAFVEQLFSGGWAGNPLDRVRDVQ